jgi:acylaminoacyl-peptidase
MKLFARLALVAAVAFAMPAFARPFTPKDLVTLDRVSDPRASPDGRFALYGLRSTDWNNNRGQNALWIVDLSARQPTPRRLPASDGGASSARWGPDGRTIYFLSSRSGSSQVWRTDPDGAAATQVTNLPIDVGAFRISPDGKKLVVAMAVFPDCSTLACTQQRLTKPEGDRSTGVVYDRMFVRHWDAWENGTRNHLFSVNVDGSGEPIDLMKGFDGDTPSKPFGDDNEFTITPDSASVVFSVRIAGQSEPWSTNFDIYRAPLDGSSAPVNRTEANKAWDTGPVFHSAGGLAAYRAMKRPGFEADRYAIMLREYAKGSTSGEFRERELAPNWDRSADAIQFSPDGRTIYALASDVGQARIFAIDVKSGRVTPLTGEGHVSAFDVTRNGIVYAADTLSGPAQLFRTGLNGGKAQQLTRHNAERLAGVDMGQFEQFSFSGWNGDKVYGYLVKPANFDPSKKYPVAFLIHGGPQSTFGNLWSYRWNAQTYAGAGYAVVMIDFHGSVGYGQGFTDAISQHWGDRPLEDLQKGWTHAQSAYPFLDANRACALGPSFGGFMINWIAGNWNEPWKCLVNHDGVFDQRMMGYGTEELWFTEWENGGTPYENPQGYDRFNPVNHVAKWRKPMLVIHGERDYRIPLDQGLATFTALQRQGIPSKFLYFPDENHWVLKPQNSVQWHDTVLGWLDQWIGNGKGAAPAAP